MVVFDAHEHSNSEDDSDFVDDDSEQDIEEDNELFNRSVVEESEEDQSKSDGLRSLEESSNNEQTRIRQKNLARLLTYRNEVDSNNVQFEVGVVFSSKDKLKGAIKEYGIKTGKKLKMKKNDKQRVRVICEGSCERNSCPWVLLATPDDAGSGWVVRTYNSTHTCAREQSNRFISATWLAKNFEDDFRINPKWKARDFIEFVRRQHGINISKNVAFKAKRKARKNILGSVDGQYARLCVHCEELKRRNANSLMLLKTIFEGDGRPKKLRKKSLAEQIPDPDRQARKPSRKYVKLKCGICRTSGHNSRKCPQRGEGSNSGHQAEAEGVPPQNPSHVDLNEYEPPPTIQPSFDMNEPQSRLDLNATNATNFYSWDRGVFSPAFDPFQYPESQFVSSTTPTAHETQNSQNY